MTRTKRIDIDRALNELTIKEKIDFLSGIDNWHLQPIDRLGIPKLRMSDGPNGVRGTKGFNGTAAACLPNATCLAATWDIDLIRKGGELQGDEALAKGASVILGPTMNMQRSPLGGRGFESFSEDPYLSGSMAAATVQGIQSKGVAATAKHFVCNDQEHERNIVNSIVTDRALREIYTLPFQLTQLWAKPWCYMTSYGKVNGLHASENAHLLQDILRGEWAADTLVMSDWYGCYSAAESVKAGLDIEMPGPPYARGGQINHALMCGKLTEYDLDCRVREILKLINRVLPLGIPSDAPESTIDTPETSAKLREIAADGIVLLKNDRKVLPFDSNKSIAIIGPNAKMTNTYAGGGSASMAPYYVVSPYEGIILQAKHAKYTEGCTGYKKLPLLSNLCQTPDGSKPGLHMKCYDLPPSSPDRKLLEEVHVSSTDATMFDFLPRTVTAAHPLWYATLTGKLTAETTGDHKFSLSVAGTGKLYLDSKLLIDNATKQTKGDSFFGLGTAEEYGTVHLKKGQTYSITLDYGSLITSPLITPGGDIQSGGLRIGCTAVTDPRSELNKAIELAQSVDQVILVAGLNADWESEGYDRTDMSLPGLTDELVTRVTAANPNTAVVIQSGTPVAMPWASNVPAILQTWYGGNETGNAIADVLFGSVNPSGKLPLTFPLRTEDNPAYLNFRSERGRALYGEDIYIGYRFYEKTKKPVLFPFGHGLSYTTFSISDLSLSFSDPTSTSTSTTTVTIKPPNRTTTLTATVHLTNTGHFPGSQTLQLYIKPPHPSPTSISRPIKELKGFAKVLLQPGEQKTVEIQTLARYAFSFWDERRKAWCVEKGRYQIGVSGVGSREEEEGEEEGGWVWGEMEIGETWWWNGV